MPDAGYSTSSEAMLRAQTRLQEAAEEPGTEAKKVAPTEIAEADFGRVHGAAFAKYKSGMDEMGAGMTGLSAELGNLGSGIGSANTKYADSESASADQASKAGEK